MHTFWSLTAYENPVDALVCKIKLIRPAAAEFTSPGQTGPNAMPPAGQSTSTAGQVTGPTVVNNGLPSDRDPAQDASAVVTPAVSSDNSSEPRSIESGDPNPSARESNELGEYKKLPLRKACI